MERKRGRERREREEESRRNDDDASDDDDEDDEGWWQPLEPSERRPLNFWRRMLPFEFAGPFWVAVCIGQGFALQICSVIMVDWYR